MTEQTVTTQDARSGTPGWPELLIALAVYVICLAGIVLWIVTLPEERAALRGIAGNAANGVAGLLAFLAAFALRLRDLRAFGFRPVAGRWLLIAWGLGLLAFVASFGIEAVYFHFITEPNTQGDMQAAAKAGIWSLVGLCLTGAVFTPLAEELVFRGVVANALSRYGAWVAVIGSAALFGIVHGPSVIFILAFLIGVLAAILMRKSGSIWPAILLHVTYNGLHLLGYAVM